jgi:TonB-linked SusC/RagA family outer membrane protein
LMVSVFCGLGVSPSLYAQSTTEFAENTSSAAIMAVPTRVETARAHSATLELTTVVQSSQIQGVIIDDTGAILRGVSIRIKGTTKGAISDKDGKYSIAASAGDVLVFSLVGYSKKEITVTGDRMSINVIMGLDLQKLEDVVVVGYGSQSKRDLTGNVAKVKAAEIADVPVPTFDAAIQGKAAGVVIQGSSGKVGSAISVRVRGQSSLSAENTPLYVVDGVPISTEVGSGITTRNRTNPLVDLNPQDIESIDILKDAASASIYGARGANGVVVITTKKGKVGKTRVNVSLQQGFSESTRRIRFLNAQEYVDYFRAAAATTDSILARPITAGNSRRALFERILQEQSLGTWGTPNAASTDWSNEILRSAPMTQLDFNISGGSERTSFYASGQYLNQTGILVGNGLERFSGRLNLEQKVSDIFTAGFNISVARSVNLRLPGDRSFTSPMQALALAPVTPAKDPATGLPVGTPPGNIDVPFYYNPLIQVGNADRTLTILRSIGMMFGEINILEGLKFRTEFGFDLLNQQDASYFNSKTQRASGTSLGFASTAGTATDNININSFFSYYRTFDAHTVDATLGFSYQRSQNRDNYAEAQDFPSDNFKMLTAGARKTDARSRQTDFAFASYFVRANYKYADKYLLSLSARVDGSSRFGENNRYGLFPAASAGWVLSSEEFLKDNSTVSFLKLRASYGLVGNAEIPNFASRNLVDGLGTYGGQPGTTPNQLGNPNLTWETTAQADIGVEFGLLDNRITGEIAVYDKQTRGMLLDVQVPATTGFNTVTQNLGRMENKGIEIVLNTENIIDEEFSWRTNLTAAFNANKVLDLQTQVIEGGLNAMSRAQEGLPIGAYYTVEYAGVNPDNGDALWYRNTRNPDGSLDRSTTNRYNEAQRVYIGNALPTWTGGVTNSFRFFRDVEFSFQFTGQFGNLLNFFGVGQFSSANARFEDNQTIDQLNSWTPTNRNTRIPQARFRLSNGDQASSRFIQDGSFVRLRTVTLAYNLPKSLLEPLQISNVRVFLTAQNLWVATAYNGWDPEVSADDIGNRLGGGSQNSISLGYDFYTAPQPRTIMVGINVGF